jgi:hypothetical protein
MDYSRQAGLSSGVSHSILEAGKGKELVTELRLYGEGVRCQC